MTLANFAVWCAQVTIVIAFGAMVPWLFRLRAPRVRLAYWQVLLVTCLALPFVQPYRVAPAVTLSGVSVSTGPAQVLTEGTTPAAAWSAEEIAMAVLGAGALIRFLWLCGGMIRLRRLRRSGAEVIPLPDEVLRVMRRLGVSADFRVSEEVTSPVTFGARNPVILLPAGFLDLAPDRREPVIFHELLHVARQDWLFAISEELLRCLLWFHPAIWWLLGRVQLTREQVVDHAVIEHTNARDEYVDALIAIAATRLEADLAPAPLFLKKRHLRQRVASISQGVSMSRNHLLVSSLAVFSALPLVVGVTAWQFPLKAAPQEVADAPGVEVVNGAFRVLHRAGVAYPVDALAKGVSGSVVVNVSTNSKGEVIDAKVVNGPEELRKAVLSSVLNWHFATNGVAPPPFDVAVRFTAGPPPVKMPVSLSGMKSYPVDRFDVAQLPQALQERLAAANLIHEGDRLSPEGLRDLTTKLRGIDDHLSLRASVRNDKWQMQLSLNNAGTPRIAPPPPATAAQPAEAPQRIKVGGNVAAANLVTKVTPSYPAEAKQARVQGTVRFQATIDKEGHVTELQLVAGHPLLVQSAVDAVKQWVYQPTLLNGNPVEVITTIDVNYTLAP